MVVLGVVLLVLCLALIAGIGLTNTEAVDATAFGVTLSNVSISGLFLLGVTLGALAVVGLGLLLSGAARKRSKRVAHKREDRERASLAQENSRLQAELGDRDPQGGPSGTPTSSDAGRTKRR